MGLRDFRNCSESAGRNSNAHHSLDGDTSPITWMLENSQAGTQEPTDARRHGPSLRPREKDRTTQSGRRGARQERSLSKGRVLLQGVVLVYF